MAAQRLSFSAVFKDRPAVGGGAAVLLLVGTAAWFLFGGSVSTGGKAPTARFTHMQCQECGEEVPFVPSLANKPCAGCGRGVYTLTVGSVAMGAAGSRLVVLLLIALSLLQGLALWWIHRWRV